MLAQKISLIVVLGVLFTGCHHDQERRIEQQRRAAQRDQDIRAAHEECNVTLKAANNKLLVEYEKCVQPKLRRIFLNYNNREGVDIFDLMLAKFMLIASKLDEKKITPEEAEVEKAEIIMRANSEGARRDLDLERNELLRLEAIDRIYNQNRPNRSTTTNCYKTLDGSISCTTR